MILTIAFLAGAALAIATAFLARWIASIFVPESATAYVGFAFALGAASARAISSNIPAIQTSAWLGGVLGLAIVWFFFFKRVRLHG